MVNNKFFILAWLGAYVTDVIHSEIEPIDFSELESRYGHESAFAILRVLEQFEGVIESHVTQLSFEERMENVFRLMRDNMRYQTRH